MGGVEADGCGGDGRGGVACVGRALATARGGALTLTGEDEQVPDWVRAFVGEPAGESIS